MITEKEADDIGMASQLQDQANDQARAGMERAERMRIEAVKKAIACGDFDGTSCCSCGEDLPAERRADYRTLCTPCQSVLETKRKQVR